MSARATPKNPPATTKIVPMTATNITARQLEEALVSKRPAPRSGTARCSRRAGVADPLRSTEAPAGTDERRADEQRPKPPAAPKK